MDLFAKNGFDNTSTKSISTQAQIATGTLFKYFKTKEELIIEAYSEAKLSMLNVIKTHLDPHQPFEELLRHMFNNMVDWCLQHPKEYQFTMQVKNSRFASTLSVDKFRNELLFFYIALKSAQDAGQIIKIPLELLEMTVGSFINLCIESQELLEGDSEKAKDLIFTMMLHAIKEKK